MNEEVVKKSDEKKSCKSNMSCPGGGAVYGLGLIGASIYYIQQAATFQEGLVGFLKALVWPAFLIHRVFQLLGM